MSGVLGQLKKTLEEHERQEKRLGNKATLTTLKAGATEAVAVVGEPPEPYLEALLEGVNESFIATVRVHDDVLPKHLLARGADVRVGPPPRVADGYQITAYQPDGTVNVVCRANEPERKTWDPERPEAAGHSNSACATSRRSTARALPPASTHYRNLSARPWNAASTDRPGYFSAKSPF